MTTETVTPIAPQKLDLARERRLRLSLQAVCSFAVLELEKAGRKVPPEPLRDVLEALQNALSAVEN